MGFSKILNIAKNPILKYLSKFAKNLSPEHLKLSFLRGEGELTNLELDEAAIMSLLDLPSWLQLRSARCNRVSIKCQWTKLKKLPIVLRLDRVVVEVEALDCPREQQREEAEAGEGKDRGDAGRYGFADKVIDGMEVSVDSVHIVFVAKVFRASIEVTKLQLCSVMANWARGEMKFTYLRDRAHDQMLLFKEIIWETTRIEAFHAADTAGAHAVRLVTNACRIRIAVKKRLSDCRVLATRVQLLLDDLLWVLTVTQLEATVMFAKSLQACVDTAAQQQAMANCCNGTEKQQQQQQQQQQIAGKRDMDINSLGPSERIFRQYDLRTTSYHLHTGRVDLHFCEDSDSEARLSKNSMANGTIQLTLLKLSLDFYPRQRVETEAKRQRVHECESQRRSSQWLQSRIKACSSSSSSSSSSQLESALVLRLQDLSMSCVSASGGTGKQPTFLASDKRRLQLPPNSLSAFIEVTQFCTFQSHSALLSHPTCVFVALNPLHLRADCDTLLWLNAFAAQLSAHLAVSMQTQEPAKSLSESNDAHTANHIEPFLLIEAKFPRLILAARCERPDHPERPSSMELLANIASLSNCYDSSGAQQTAAAVADWQQVADLADTDTSSQRRRAFPHAADDSDAEMPQALLDDSAGSSSSSSSSSSSVWQLHCQQLWCEFAGAKAFKPRQQAFLQPLPLLLLARQLPDTGWGLLLQPQAQSVRLLLTHYQYLFLMRLVEEMAECKARADADRAAIGEQQPNSAAVAPPLRLSASCRCLHFGIVLPALCEMRPLPSSPLPPSCRLGQPKQADRIRISDSVRCVHLDDGDGEEFARERYSPTLESGRQQQQQQRQRQQQPKLSHAAFSSPLLGKISHQFRGFGQRIGRAVGHGSTGNLSDTDAADWDKMSMSSGVSSELERSEQLQFILEATRERPDSRAELSDRLSDLDAASADAPDSPISASSSSSRCRDTVSCLTLSLVSAVASVSLQEAGSLVKLVARDLGVSESGNVNYEELLAADAAPPVSPPPSESGTRLRLRAFLDDRRTDSFAADSLLQVRVCDLQLKLAMSSVTNVADFIEDELLYSALPLRLELERLQLHLAEDRPCSNLSCPGDHPTLKVELPHLSLFRDLKEVIHLLSEPKRRSSERELCDPSALRAAQQDNSKLQFLLAQCQDEIDYLRRERESLLKALTATQAELHRRPHQQQQQQHHRGLFTESHSPFFPRN